jgi:hypothetical protein
LFEQRGALVPPDDDPRHVPDPLRLIEVATADVTPLYVRDPDAKAAA